MSRKQIVLRIDSIDIKKDEDGESKSFNLVPTTKDLLKDMKVKIKSELLIQKLDIPTQPGDTIVLEFGAKEVQSKIIKEEPEE